MSGILMGIRLKEAGYGFTIVEKADRVGGTWRDNSYPGLHCDVPSHHYRYTFAPHADWSHTYSSGPDIRAYLDRTAERHGLMPHIRFNAAATEGVWENGRWRVMLSTGETLEADILVSATGVLHVPVTPEIPGLESFAGPTFHTSRWDHNVALEDKRIGLIGTGSTAVQIVCALSGKVCRLELFQRTAQWVLHLPNPPISPWRRMLYRAFPQLMEREFRTIEDQTSVLTGGAIMGLDPQARAALEKNVEDNLASVRDPVLRGKLTPGFEVGCKRLIMSPSFYEAVQDPSVDVVTDRIDHIEPRGIVTADGTLHAIDVLALATGFDPNAYVRPMRLTGRDGHTLDEVWAERPIAYRSMAVPHMPNFFMIEGPFSPVGNLSLILVSEWQAEYIMKCIETVRRDRVALSPDPQVTATMIADYREAARHTIWAKGGCQSWYQDEEGVPIIYPYPPARFRDEMKADPDLADFVVEPLPGDRALATAG